MAYYKLGNIIPEEQKEVSNNGIPTIDQESDDTGNGSQGYLLQQAQRQADRMNAENMNQYDDDTDSKKESITKKKYPKEAWYNKALRNVSAGLIKGAGSAASIPGEIVKFGESLPRSFEQRRNEVLEHALQQHEKGNDSYLYGSNPEDVRNQLENFKKNPQTPELVLTPQIQKIEQNVQKKVQNLLPKDYLETRGKGEDIFQDMVGAIPLHFAFGGSVKGIMPMLSNLALGESAAQGVKYFGGGEGAQMAARLGVPTIKDAFKSKHVKKFATPIANKLYKKAFEAGANKSIAVPHIKNEIETFLHKEGLGVFENTAKNKANLFKIEDRVKNDSISLQDLADTKEHLNRLIYQEKRTNLPKYFDKLLSSVNKGIDEAAKVAPGFTKNLRKADKIHAMISKMERADSIINELASAKKYTEMAKTLIPQNLKGQAHMIANFPGLSAKYYATMLKGAAMNNPNLVKKSLDRMLHEYNKGNIDKNKPKDTGKFYKIK